MDTTSVKNLIRYTSQILFMSDFGNKLEYAAGIVKSVYTAHTGFFLTALKLGTKTAFQETRHNYYNKLQAGFIMNCFF
jgi:hypothetical protein